MNPAPTCWFTGLSGAGKSTLARAVFTSLTERCIRAELLDADQVRPRLAAELGFDRAGREENVRRLGYLAALLARHGVVPVVASMSPFQAGRAALRLELAPFVEVFVDAPVAVCERRDPAGIYRRFRQGALHHLSGLDDPYEPPPAPEVHCRTDREDVRTCATRVLAALEPHLR